MQFIYEQAYGFIVQMVPSLFVFFLASFIFTICEFFPSNLCNPENNWWKNHDFYIDIAYFIFNTLIRRYMFLVIAILIWSSLSIFFQDDKIKNYILGTNGPFGQLAFYEKIIIYLIVSDFTLYWLHRAFHHPILWRYHSIHHSEKQVEWTTAYRFHPVNLACSSILTDVVLLYLGITPDVLIFVNPFNAAYSFFVHANLNWTLGPFKFLLATPVFHRWHHTNNKESYSKNFSATFTIWDQIFGTFYFPENKLPKDYGVDDSHFPDTFLGQIMYPLRKRQ